MANMTLTEFQSILSRNLSRFAQPHKDNLTSLLSALGTSDKERQFAAALSIVMTHYPPDYGPHGLGSKKKTKAGRKSRKKQI
jgi:hypothetical protein